MAAVKMSESAYTEFKEFLQQNNVNSDTIRIFVAGMGWSGPQFNIALDEQKSSDVTEVIGELNFLVDGELFKEYKGFEIKSPAESGVGGFTIEPNEKPEGSCSSCSGGCH